MLEAISSMPSTMISTTRHVIRKLERYVCTDHMYASYTITSAHASPSRSWPKRAQSGVQPCTKSSIGRMSRSVWLRVRSTPNVPMPIRVSLSAQTATPPTRTSISRSRGQKSPYQTAQASSSSSASPAVSPDAYIASVSLKASEAVPPPSRASSCSVLSCASCVSVAGSSSAAKTSSSSSITTSRDVSASSSATPTRDGEPCAWSSAVRLACCFERSTICREAALALKPEPRLIRTALRTWLSRLRLLLTLFDAVRLRLEGGG